MKKIIAFACVAIITCAAFAPQTKWNAAQVWNLKANNTPTATGKYNGQGVPVSGGVRDTCIAIDTTNALFVCDYASDLIISDSIVRTSGILAGTAKLYGTDDTIAGGVWYQVVPDTISTSGLVGLNGFTSTNTASQKAAWLVSRFKWHFGKVRYIGATGNCYQILKVYGKY